MPAEEINHKKQLEEKIFFTQADAPGVKKVSYLSLLGWSWQKVKKGVISLFILQVLVYALSWWPALRQVALTVIDPLLLLFFLLYVGWVLVKLKLFYHKNLKQSEMTLFVLGGSLGMLVSWLKLIYFRQAWTLINLIVEPLYMAALAMLVGLVLWWLIRLK